MLHDCARLRVPYAFTAGSRLPQSRHRRSMRRPDTISPNRVFLLVLGVVFTVEVLIMVVFATTGFSSANGLLLSVIDALVLVAVLCPVLWMLVVRPLRSMSASRGALLAHSLTMQEEERAKLARDLHDEVGQVQTAILLGTRSIAAADTLQQAHERAETVHQMASEAVEATRRIARGLSPSVLLDFGLGPAVERVCEDIAATGTVELVRDIRMGTVRVDPAVEIAAYRVLQEAITNAAKHSGASSIRVSLYLDGDQLRLCVADNGRGLPAVLAQRKGAGTGLGLAGMRERVTLLHGDYYISSNSQGGTSVVASIPVERASP